MNGNLIFDVESFRDLTLSEATDAFERWVWSRPERNRGHWGTPLKAITMKDLAIHNEGYPSNGLYIFYDSSGVIPAVRYVGKCTSRSFLERIPAHLESRAECWFSTLTKRALDYLPPIDDGAAPNLETASDWCLDNLSVALIPMECGDRDPKRTKSVGLLERRLRDPKGLAPAWNTCHTKVGGKYLTEDTPLVDDLLQPPREPARPVL